MVLGIYLSRKQASHELMVKEKGAREIKSLEGGETVKNVKKENPDVFKCVKKTIIKAYFCIGLVFIGLIILVNFI